MEAVGRWKGRKEGRKKDDTVKRNSVMTADRVGNSTFTQVFNPCKFPAFPTANHFFP